MVSESTLRSAGTLLSRVRAPPPPPLPDALQRRRTKAAARLLEKGGVGRSGREWGGVGRGRVGSVDSANTGRCGPGAATKGEDCS
ncbi:hypothetical protein PoB_002424100 [Plakobranchus ocellatus]|uniref:Uncharacterized protein n=1 Tax=Plakobranchus ocellatus TaxID=259542 RepID=A0AAV3ZT89_9GAST|nr:hypothetical protein PoB_002424100 [Plakobranchus ocellatus]